MPYSPILLFLGAGASAPFGVPPMKQMVAKLSDRGSALGTSERLLLEQLTPRLKEYFGDRYDLEKLLDVVQDISSGSSTRASFGNVAPHALFRYRGLLERSGGGQTENAEKALDASIYGDARTAESLEAQIAEQIAAWCAEANFDAARDAYSDLFEQIGQRKITEALRFPYMSRYVPSETDGGVPAMTLVTTNYDECLERSLSRLGVAPSMGFYFDPVSRLVEFSTRPEPRQYQRPTNEGPQATADAPQLILLKLHGSTNWWRTSDNRVVEIANGVRGQVVPDGAYLARREIRYPVATKDLVGLPYSALYSWFASALANSKVWLFIGYSFGDSSVLRLMQELWTPSKKVVVVGRHASDVSRTVFKPPLGESVISVDAEFRDPNVGRHDWGAEISAAIQRMKPNLI